MNRIRQLHLWLGVFFAPMIIFFALTGALQTFGLHETHPGSAYKAPVWIARLAGVHKDQRWGKSTHKISSFALKWFVLFLSMGLVTTTFLGIYMSFLYQRDHRLIWTLLVLGAVLPMLLLL